MSDDRPSKDGVSVPATERPPDAPRVAYLPPEAIPAANHRPDMDGAQRTHPLSFAVGAINGLRNAVVPIAAVLYSMRGESYVLPAALGIGLLVVLVNGGISYLQWRKLTYRVVEADIRVESGIVSRAARSVPYERIQDVSLEQALIPRLLGLVEVRFETGAGGGDELKLSYLTEEEGERLRETVRDRKEAEGPSSAAAASEDGEASAQSEPAARALFAMDPRRVFTFGLFEFSLAVVAVLAGAVQQFDLLIDFDLWEMDRWQELLGGPGTWLAGLGPFAQIASFLVALATLALVGVVTGVIRTVLREWGFVLERTAKGFRRRRGLLTRTDVVMPVHRVQALVIGTKIIRRLMGWHSMKFVSLAQDAGSSSHVVAPFAQMEEIRPIVRESGFGLPGEDVRWFAADRKYRTDRAAIWAAVLGAMAIGAMFTPQPLLALLPLAAIPLAMGTEWMRWRTTRFAADARQLYTREFWLAPRRKIASRTKLHSAEIVQGPLARRRGYATLQLGLAGGSLDLPGLPLQRARKLRAAVLDSIAATDFSRIEGAHSQSQP